MYTTLKILVFAHNHSHTFMHTHTQSLKKKNTHAHTQTHFYVIVQIINCISRKVHATSLCWHISAKFPYGEPYTQRNSRPYGNLASPLPIFLLYLAFYSLFIKFFGFIYYFILSASTDFSKNSHKNNILKE